MTVKYNIFLSESRDALQALIKKWSRTNTVTALQSMTEIVSQGPDLQNILRFVFVLRLS